MASVCTQIFSRASRSGWRLVVPQFSRNFSEKKSLEQGRTETSLLETTADEIVSNWPLFKLVVNRVQNLAGLCCWIVSHDNIVNDWCAVLQHVSVSPFSVYQCLSIMHWANPTHCTDGYMVTWWHSGWLPLLTTLQLLPLCVHNRWHTCYEYVFSFATMHKYKLDWGIELWEMLMFALNASNWFRNIIY
jgi:hypothetical protein